MKGLHDVLACASSPARNIRRHDQWIHNGRVLVVLILVVLPSSAAVAQDTTRHDPLLGNYILANSAELVCLRDFRGGTPALTVSQRLFDFLPNGQIAPGGSPAGYTNSRVLSDARWIDAVACDVNGDGKDELVTGWAGELNAFTISVSSASPPSWNWTDNILEGSTDTTVAGPVRIVSANLDSIPGQEIITCYSVNIGGTAGGILFSLYDSVDQTGRLVKYGSELVSMPLPEYDLSVGDFDRDGLDEVIAAFQYVDVSGRVLLLTVVDFPERRQVSFWPWQPFPMADTLWNHWKRLKVTAGDFRRRGTDEAVVSVTHCSGDSGKQVFAYVEIDPDLRTFSMDISYDTGIADAPAGWSWGYGWESDAVAADLNPVKNIRDGDELVVAGPNEVAVLSFNNVDLEPVCKARIPFLHSGMRESYERRRLLAVADVNADSSSDSWNSEIVLAEHPQDSTTVLQSFRVELDPWNDNQIIGVTRVSERLLAEGTCKSEIVVGDFDGDAIRLARPRFIAKRSFHQPLVQLNVPPTHFDYLTGEVFDVCQTAGGDSSFSVRYSETQSHTSQFSSMTGSSWGVSTSAGGGFSLFGLKVKASVGSSYEQGYYYHHSTSATTTTSQMTRSWGNDMILATVCDYDLWEYPLYIGGIYSCGVLVQIPHYQYTVWFDNKNQRAFDWTADHEVGNILSYRRVNEIPSHAGGRLLTSFQGITIAQGASGSWTLDLSGQNIDSTLLMNDVGIDVGASISGWGMESRLAFAYSGQDIITHTSMATRYATITVEVGEIHPAIAEANYVVLPYIYWGREGALVIDYAVEPSLDNSGDTTLYTFWQNKYLAHPDPGFILPWRLDSLKGIATNPNYKLYCKDLRVSPAEPSVGDHATITATIHNLSLTETAGPVTVRFYLGNPSSGGIPIVGTDSVIDVTTLLPIPARDRAIVTKRWVVPEGVNSTTRIYAVIDPGSAMSEIHEDNNIGFIPLRASATTGVEDEVAPLVPQCHDLQQNYPNPFNPNTTIAYHLSTRSHITLKVFDILGREVAGLVDEVQEPGYKSLQFAATGLASGVYFYRLHAGSFMATKKMLLLR